jgi:maltose O-acetyltransferase
MLKVDGQQARLQVLNLAASALPRRNAGQARARLFALAGFRIGEGTLLDSSLRLSGSDDVFARLVIGKSCSIGDRCTFELEASVTIGDWVTIGPGVMILTSARELGSSEQRAGAISKLPVVIGDGALVGARSIIMAGVTVGAGAVINPGAVVNQDVPSHTRVGGAPATQVEVLNVDDASTT